MLALERRNLILEKLQEEKKVVVSELSQLYQVSEETIRRDLDKLDRDGYALKSYGGAVLNENTNVDLPSGIRKKSNVPGKQKIGKLLCGIVNDGDYIALDASTTAVFIAKALKQKEHLTVLTNSVEVTLELADVSNWNVISTGGYLKEGYLTLTGNKTIQDLESYNVDKAIVSGKGFDLIRGLTDGADDLSQPKQAMLKSAKTKIVAVDGSKWNKVAFSKITDLSQIDIVVTDVKPDDRWMEAFDRYQIKCLYPKD